VSERWRRALLACYAFGAGSAVSFVVVTHGDPLFIAQAIVLALIAARRVVTG